MARIFVRSLAVGVFTQISILSSFECAGFLLRAAQNSSQSSKRTSNASHQSRTYEKASLFGEAFSMFAEHYCLRSMKRPPLKGVMSFKTKICSRPFCIVSSIENQRMLSRPERKRGDFFPPCASSSIPARIGAQNL